MSDKELLVEVINGLESVRGQIEHDNRGIVAVLEQILKELAEIRKRTGK
jgi:hypothetical protein